MYKNFFKRLIDFVAAIILLVLVSPLLIIVCSVLFLVQGNPFFIQKRPGKNHVIFSIIKLRTMNNKSDNNGMLLSDKERLTGIGKLIRKTSLDELPQLINVIKGDLSFIGPRPLLVEYLELYSPEQKNRHNCRPGITGWAQVNGRNNTTWERRFEHDLFYVENMSFWLDLKVVFLTIYKIFRTEGVSADGVATMEKFQGNKVV